MYMCYWFSVKKKEYKNYVLWNIKNLYSKAIVKLKKKEIPIRFF